MDNNITELVFILDRSGSMNGLEADTIGGFNSFISEQKKEDGEAYVTTVLFDNGIQVIHDRLKLEDVPKMTDKEYTARGTTALLDAVGDTVKHISNIHRYARKEDIPSKTLFVITTDGAENASTHYSYQNVKELIEEQKKTGWEFIFLGANIDAAETAVNLGIGREYAADYVCDALGTALNFKTVGQVASLVRIGHRISKDWNKKINADKNKRNKGGN